MGRRRVIKPHPEASVASLYWTYQGRDELERRMTASLAGLSKEELISFVCESSMRWPALCRHVLMQTEHDQPLTGLIGDIEAAIRAATYVPKEKLNRNFDYDIEEYEQVRIGLRKLMRLGYMTEAMDLAIELLFAGNDQIDASDEGLMAEEIVECVNVVTQVVEATGSEAERQAWAQRLASSDDLSILGRNRE
ncbi:MAG: hypothetical protein U0795_15560 [Pirellulales bacterium]